MDILVEDWAQSPDILVSNPPYIPIEDRAKMSKNVVDHEPGIALFVPDNDPMIFYRRIGEIGMKCLKVDGRLYVEIHEKLGSETASLFVDQGYRAVKIHKDLNGKERMVSAIR
jgi:release factor glutamine methyltransferase